MYCTWQYYFASTMAIFGHLPKNVQVTWCWKSSNVLTFQSRKPHTFYSENFPERKSTTGIIGVRKTCSSQILEKNIGNRTNKEPLILEKRNYTDDFQLDNKSLKCLINMFREMTVCSL